MVRDPDKDYGPGLNFNTTAIAWVLLGIGILAATIMAPSENGLLIRFLGGTSAGCAFAVGVIVAITNGRREADRKARAREEFESATALAAAPTNKKPYNSLTNLMAQQSNIPSFLRASTTSFPFGTELEPIPGQDGTEYWCSDCGMQYVPWTKQLGFNPTTGSPNMSAFFACPNWDVNKTMDSPYARSMYYNCGKLVETPATAQAHNAHATDDVDPSCPGCLEQMVHDGIITREQAAARAS